MMWVKALKDHAGISYCSLQFQPVPPALLYSELHLLQKLAEVLGQLSVRQAGQRRRFERSNSRLRRRRRYGERDLEQVEGARRRSLVRHRLDMGIQPP